MRIVVAMSGGVDSSVVAGLMHQAGHEVIGVTLQLYDQGAAAGRRGACCAGADIHDAKRVADRLGFAHYVIDAEQIFRASVIDEFADSYANGSTPVPCVSCNQHLKFGFLLDMARDLGAEAMATGHYVKRVEGPDGAQLHVAADPVRDQSWFLFATTREQLEFSRFPLGDMQDKAQVRAIAAEMGLAVADKPDSQDICFVPSGSYADIVTKLRPETAEPGEIVTAAGEVVGAHQGIARYTVGQGKRLGEASERDGARQIVTAIDAATRRIVIGPRSSGARLVQIERVNWLIEPPSSALRARVKLRARQAPEPAQIMRTAQGAEIHLDEPGLAAPGQACVIYDGTRVLGGGFIAAPARP
ncbi:MAG: tRNA 2-thiouridine(34) synthase MnmA [Rhodospirillales bacterium 20-60-12]|nr:MAG: tRNA 2-thiouridine(34) synthase MnmA [Rhodospirillales bacterium 20-60-12]HQT67367.1 tRNA 2-thiouridine(34) synthase MnmA [Acetobacteraceae bacterium]HQU00827.1 tRNA 2-thiouridine(34) synthase MnmA [Acetobacteraceae bacterium]